MNHRYNWIAFSVSAICLLLVAQQASAAYLVPLAVPPGADLFFVTPSAVSADGSVVVGTACTTGHTYCGSFEAWRWTNGGGMTSLGAEFAGEVSADGSVVVGGTNGFEAFRWTSNSGMVGLGYLPGDTSSWVSGVSADGSVLVGGSSPSVDGFYGAEAEAFRWTSDGGMVGLGYLPGGDFHSAASDVSADGSVVVGTSRASVDGFYVAEAFRWTSDGGMVGLGMLAESDESFVSDVSADGSVVVGTSYTELHRSEAFRWTSDGGMVGLGYLPGGDSE
jgi:probable HAF family extracellular repeat protein